MARAFELGPLQTVRVWVRDLDAARTFYGETLGLTQLFDGPVLTFQAGAVVLVVERAEPDDAEGQELVGRFLGVSFKSPDVQAVHEGLAARGVSFLEPPERQPWGAVFAHFRDPDGNVFTVAEYAES